MPEETLGSGAPLLLREIVDHDQDVDVALLVRLAAGLRPEEHHLLHARSEALAHGRPE